jgi:hypothetical protein
MREKEIDLQLSMREEEEEEKKKIYYRNGQSHHLSYMKVFFSFLFANIQNQSTIEMTSKKNFDYSYVFFD